MTSSAEPPDSENCDQLWECFPTTSRCVDRIAFSPDGKLIASCNYNSLEEVKLWDVESGKQLSDMNSRLHASDFTLPVSSGEKVYYLFDFYRFTFKSFFFSCNPKDLTYWGSVWDQTVGKVVYVREIKSHLKYRWQTVAVSPDLQVTASACKSPSAITLWETSTGIDKHTFCLNEKVREISDIYVNQFSPDGKIFASLFSFGGYSSSGKEKIKLWQVETGKELCSISLLQDATNSWNRILAFSSDSRILASNCGDSFNRVIVLLETATGVELCRFQGFGKKNSHGSDKVTSLAFSPDNQLLASGDSTGVITLWRLSKGWLRPLRARKIRTLISCESYEPVKTLAFSPDGELLAIAATRNITLWQVSSGEKIHTIDRVHRAWGRCMAFSPNGQTLAFTITDEAPLRLWNVETGNETCLIDQSHYKVTWLDFSRNGQVLVSSHSDGTIKVWQQNKVLV
ncbi:hypothetical protein KBT16_26840 [Nostoc sp. CCCryo 231-06]|nr:hypothetical protein [Nostoc sp. CCCryo 231-06]